jgi:mRNA interferase MazF
MVAPLRGEIWFADLNPPREQAGRRPVLVVSTDPFNECAAEVVVVLPLTSKHKGIGWHVLVEARGSGLRTDSYVMCDAIRSISKERLTRRVGEATPGVMSDVAKRLRVLLEI